MDEIDAALDFKNVSIVAHYIKVGDTSSVKLFWQIESCKSCFHLLLCKI